MGQYQDVGVVLRARPYREADSLVTIFGVKSGKIGAIAKGARRPHSRIAAGLQPLAYTAFTLYRGRSDLETVVAAELTAGFLRLRSDLDRISWGLCLAEVVDELFSLRDPSPEAFYLFVAGLEALNDLRDPYSAGLTAIWQLLHAAGLGWDAERCGGCRQVLPQGARFDLERGHFYCGTCVNGIAPAGLRTVSPGGRKTLSQWTQVPAARMGTVLAQGKIREELFKLLRAALMQHTGRPLRSLDFMGRLEAPGSPPGP